ncbi:MAG: ABC transporter substrate-binding protein [Bacteroidia bacterium]
MNVKRNLFLLLLSFSQLVIACVNKKNNAQDTTARVNDSLKYVKIADAENFLPSWSKENTVVYQWIAEPDVLHPTNGNNIQRTEILVYTQMFLVFVDFRSLELIPILIKRLPEISPDGLKVTFELRDGPKWDDGEPLSVEDIIFTAKANKCPFVDNPNNKPYWDNLKNIERDSVNPRKFTAVMKQIYMHNVAFWGDYPIMQRKFIDPLNILSKFSFEQFDDPKSRLDHNKELRDWANNFNSAKFGREIENLQGLGPYKIISWEAGQTITLTRKESYWGNAQNSIYEASYPDKIIFKINRDVNSQILEFKSQADDASTTVSTKTLMELQSDTNFNANYNSMFTDSYNYTYIGMNTKPDGIKHKKLFTDKNVRRAIALLVPVNDINRILNKGKNKRSVGPVSFLKPDFNSTLKPLPCDIEEAKRLLTEAGWKDTDGDNILDKIIDNEKVNMEFNFNYFTTQVEWKDMATMVADALYKAGIKANLTPLDFPVFFASQHQHDFDMLLASWGQSSTPEDFTQTWHTSSWTNFGSNFTGFGNSLTDALIDSIKATLNDSLRNEMSKRFQQIVYDEQPYVFLFATLRRNIMHKRFGNQELYFERPGILLNNLKLLTGTSVAVHDSPTQ